MTRKKCEEKLYIIRYNGNECNETVYTSLTAVKEELEMWDTDCIEGVIICEVVPVFNVTSYALRYEEIK